MPKQRPWTTKHAAKDLEEKLGLTHTQYLLVLNTLERVAEHYVFEGQRAGQQIEYHNQRQNEKQNI